MVAAKAGYLCHQPHTVFTDRREDIDVLRTFRFRQQPLPFHHMDMGRTVGCESLLDQEYTRHLTVPAATAFGDLSPGEKIPEPGRYGYVTVNWIF